jgi:nucleoside-diphosphate-sugar epimerase
MSGNSLTNEKVCLVTGAAGFLAQRVVRRLLDDGFQVRGLIRSAEAARRFANQLPESQRDRFEAVLGDFTREDDCDRAVAGCSLVFHLAAQMTGGVAPLILTNVVGTKRLIHKCAENGVGRFVLVSSIAVCDTQLLRRNGTVDESLPLESTPHLRDPYTYSKTEQEAACQEACSRLRLPLVIVRPGVIYGEGRVCMSSRVGLSLGGFYLVFGGRHVMPYVHVDNCADAVALAGTSHQAAGQVFNIVDDELPTGRQVIRAHRRHGRKLRSVTIPLFVVRALARLNEWYHRRSEGQLPAVLTRYKVAAMWKPLRYSNSLAKQRLGWSPRVGLPEAMASCF